MSRFLVFAPLALAGLLASCAPAITDTAGRIVNKASGQEGRVQFLGGFQAKAVTPGMADNVTVQLGQDFYSGQYSVIGSSSNALGVSASFGFGSGYRSADTRPVGTVDGGLRTTYDPRRDTARPGNLIVKTQRLNTAAIKTLTCDFKADASRHGVGDCTGSDGASYTLQF
ncbi:hypothetical protein [Deinococcus sp.]|uniref:hypothetical protein n=1 Tax=Deinococcus sp. TaxID=47478 RepID=UPI003B595550